MSDNVKEILHLFDIGKINIKESAYYLENERKQFASEFAEWCYDNDIFAFENVKELLEIYKKEK